MGLQQGHRCLLLGLLVLGCIGLACTPATGDPLEANVTWNGEGTIRVEYNADKLYGLKVWRGTREGVFTITFKPNEGPEGGGSQTPCSLEGSGTATVTDTIEFTTPGKIITRCTGRLQATMPVSVSGVKEGNTLRLKLLDASPSAGAKPTPPLVVVLHRTKA